VADFVLKRRGCHSVLVEHVQTTAAGYSIDCFRHNQVSGPHAVRASLDVE
jgi:hypothetical protein